MQKVLFVICLVFGGIVSSYAQINCAPQSKLFCTKYRTFNSYLLLDTTTGVACYESHSKDMRERYSVNAYLVPHNADTALISERFAVISKGDSLILYTRANVRDKESFDLLCMCHPKQKAIKFAAFYPASGDDVLQWLDAKNLLSESSARSKVWGKIYDSDDEKKGRSWRKKYADFHAIHKHDCPEDYLTQLELFVNETPKSK
jgi:hypothetical protein